MFKTGRLLHSLSPFLDVHGAKGGVIQAPFDSILQVIKNDGAGYLLDAQLAHLRQVMTTLLYRLSTVTDTTFCNTNHTALAACMSA